MNKQPALITGGAGYERTDKRLLTVKDQSGQSKIRFN